MKRILSFTPAVERKPLKKTASYRLKAKKPAQKLKDKISDMIAEFDGVQSARHIAQYRSWGLNDDTWKTAKEYMDKNPAFAKGVKRNYKNASRFIKALNENDPNLGRYVDAMEKVRHDAIKEIYAVLEKTYPDPVDFVNHTNFRHETPFRDFMDKNYWKR